MILDSLFLVSSGFRFERKIHSNALETTKETHLSLIKMVKMILLQIIVPVAWTMDCRSWLLSVNCPWNVWTFQTAAGHGNLV